MGVPKMTFGFPIPCVFRISPAWVVSTALALTACDDLARQAARVAAEIEPYFDHAEHEPAVLAGHVLTAQGFLAIPRSILAVDGYLIIADLASDSVFHVLDRFTGAYIRSMARRGFGPGEFSTAPSLAASPAEEALFYAYDLTNDRLTRIGVPDGEVVPFGPLTSRRLPTTHIVWELVMTGPEQAVATGFFQNGRLAFMDLADQTTSFRGPLPADDPVRYDVLHHAYKSSLAATPSRTRFVLLTRRGSQIEIYDSAGRLVRKFDGPYPFPVDYMVEGRGASAHFVAGLRNRFGYRSAAATEEHIYALFSGRAEAHFRGAEGWHGEFLHVFTWDGELARVFRLDRALTRIALDADAAMLYGISEDPEPAVVAFRLPLIE